MEFFEYELAAGNTAVYPVERGLEYCCLGLASEAGEICGRVKKFIRDERGVPTSESRNLAMVRMEIGDCLWYLAMICIELDISLDHVAQANLAKLMDRKQRGVLGGDGDAR